MWYDFYDHYWMDERMLHDDEFQRSLARGHLIAVVILSPVIAVILAFAL